MPATTIIPFVLLALVPLAHSFAVLSPWLIVPLLLLIFVVGDHVFGIVSFDRISGGSEFFHRLPLWLYIPAQLGVTLWGITVCHRNAGGRELIGLAVATGATAGVFGMLAAHEMIHSGHTVERVLGLGMLAGATYLHFRIAHIYGHHRLAATPSDAASARRGESAYRFVVRSAVGQFVFAWRFEHARAQRRRWPILANRCYHYVAITLAIYSTIGGLSGLGVIFEAIQSVTAIFILELFNYVAHYGLVRRETVLGIEPLGPVHSWNTMRRFSNWMLFNGGHHARHHRAPAMAYQYLATEPAMPQMPFGLGGSIIMALVPPLWCRVMEAKLAGSAQAAIDPDTSGERGAALARATMATGPRVGLMTSRSPTPARSPNGP